MAQAERARAFAALHERGRPLVLYNVWDAGSARAVAEAGAAAIATGSWSVAAAQGYEDGEQIPFDLLETVAGRIVASVELPVTVDVEGGYGTEPGQVAGIAERIIAAGAVGINLEDQVVGGQGLHPTDLQAARIAAVRAAADAAGVPLFINARTDLFLKERDQRRHRSLLEPARERAKAYADAGASGFFVPGLVDAELIAALCDSVELPLNVMMREGLPGPERLAALGVARISYGPGPYLEAMAELRGRAEAAFGASG